MERRRHFPTVSQAIIAVLPPHEFAVDSRAMTLHIELPESIARHARDLAAREHITVDSLIAAAQTAHQDLLPLAPVLYAKKSVTFPTT